MPPGLQRPGDFLPVELLFQEAATVSQYKPHSQKCNERFQSVKPAHLVHEKLASFPDRQSAVEKSFAELVVFHGKPLADCAGVRFIVHCLQPGHIKAPFQQLQLKARTRCNGHPALLANGHAARDQRRYALIADDVLAWQDLDRLTGDFVRVVRVLFLTEVAPAVEAPGLGRGGQRNCMVALKSTRE
ncbi:hypothetical protein BDV95DRAFT_181655, partial [Massariosphaeria phaeospora]